MERCKGEKVALWKGGWGCRACPILLMAADLGLRRWAGEVGVAGEMADSSKKKRILSPEVRK